VLRLSRYEQKRDRKSAISLQRGQFDPKFQVEGIDPHQSFFARIVRPMNALQLLYELAVRLALWPHILYGSVLGAGEPHLVCYLLQQVCYSLYLKRNLF